MLFLCFFVVDRIKIATHKNKTKKVILDNIILKLNSIFCLALKISKKATTKTKQNKKEESTSSPNKTHKKKRDIYPFFVVGFLFVIWLVEIQKKK